MKGNLFRAALTGGIVWGLTVFLTTWISLYLGYGKVFLDWVASIYPGYGISVLGSFIGLIYGFLDMFVGVYIIVWVYRQVGKFIK